MAATITSPRIRRKNEDLWAEIEDEEVLRLLDQKEQEAKANMSPGSLWSRLQRNYSKVLAFEYDHGCEILSIRPQDIGLLPREIWVYGNNSFLLHGYYNYPYRSSVRVGDGSTQVLIEWRGFLMHKSQITNMNGQGRNFI